MNAVSWAARSPPRSMRQRGPASILLPLAGFSAIDKAGEAFDDPDAREALFEAIRRNNGETEVIELPFHINDPEFAEAAARKLIELINQSDTKPA